MCGKYDQPSDGIGWPSLVRDDTFIKGIFIAERCWLQSYEMSELCEIKDTSKLVTCALSQVVDDCAVYLWHSW